MRESRTTRKRLPVGNRSVYEPNLAHDTFYQTVRPAIAALPDSGSKRHRVMWGLDNWIVSAKRQLQEAMVAGATDDQIKRVVASFDRAVRDMLFVRMPPSTPADLTSAILQETAANGCENLRAVDVLSVGSLGAIEAHWQSARAQRDASQALMEALECRARELGNPLPNVS